MNLGVVLERRRIDNRWQPFRWRVVGVIPGAPGIDEPQVLRQVDDDIQYHAATLAVELHRRETEGYKLNLSKDTPVIYIILHGDEDDDVAMPRPFIVTACPYEAQDYLDSGGLDDMVDSVPMPEAVQGWVAAYVDEHHVDEVFKKRKRKQWKNDEPNFGPRPPARIPRRH